MGTETQFRKLAGWAAIVAMPVGYASFLIAMAAVDFDVESVTDPALTLPAIAGRATMFWWSWVLTALYFLLWVPLALLLFNWFRTKSANLVGLLALCGIAGLMVGAIGQVATGAVALTEADGYAQATEAARLLRSEVYKGFFQAFDLGISRVLFPFLIGVWLSGIGSFLRKERRVLGWFTIILGLIALIAAIITAVGLVDAGSNVIFIYIALAPIWGLWIGIDLLRSRPASMS